VLACSPATSEPTTTPTAGPAESSVSLADLLAASNLPATIEAPLPNDAMGVTIHRLSNGLTVYISTDREKPTVSTWISVRTGGRNDPADSTGLAHYLEHMLFKGTDELGTLDIAAEEPHLARIAELYQELRETEDPAERERIFASIDAETQATAKTAIPNEFSRLYGALGIDGVNAFTNDDSTVYIANVPSTRLEAWARTEAERFADPRFRLFYPELEAVYEEKNRALDSPWRTAYELTRAALFPAHPYGTQTVIGTPEHLKNPAYADMVAYFERWYVPNNMAVILAGDIDPETAIPLLEQTLGQLAPKPLTAPEPGDLATPKGRVFREFKAEGEETVAIAWRTVARSHADEPALTVLDWLMDNSTSGLINRELTLTQKLPQAGSAPSFLAEGGYWQVSGTAREGQSLDQVEAMLLEVVSKLKAGEFSQEMVDAILLHEEIREQSSLEQTFSRVARMNEAFITRQEWDAVLARTARMQRVTRDEVIAAANRYLGDDRVVVYRRAGKPELPKMSKPTITPVEVDPARKSPFFTEILAIPATQLEPDWLVEGQHFQLAKLPAGTLVHAPNPRNDLFSISFDIARGEAEDKLLCHAVDVLEMSGTSSKSVTDIREQLYALGSSVNLSCDADEVTLSVAGIDRNMDATLALAREWIRDAKFDDETVARITANKLSQRRDQLDDADALPWLLREYAWYGERSEYLQQPSNRELERAKASALQARVRKLLDVGHTVRYFGPRSLDQVQPALTVGTGKIAGKTPRPADLRDLPTTTIYVIDKQVAKASVAVAVPYQVRPDADLAEAELAGEYFGGSMSGVMFQEIRESRGLAYFATAYFSTGSRKGDEWALIGQMQTQVDKTVDALALMLELLGRPVEPTRLDDAKLARDQSFRSSRVSPRWITGYVGYWLDRGFTSDPRPAVWDQTKGLDAAAINQFLAPVGAAAKIVTITADVSKLDMDALAKLGKVVMVTPEQLTSWGAFAKPRASASPG
jgi:predicted Zn-dependent peptidase